MENKAKMRSVLNEEYYRPDGKMEYVVDPKPTIVLDFDGVIHRYSRGYQGPELYDPPMEGCREALVLLNRRFRIAVSTTRSLENVRNWLLEYDLARYVAEVTNMKPVGLVYVDDRGYRFKDWNKAIVDIHVLAKETK